MSPSITKKVGATKGLRTVVLHTRTTPEIEKRIQEVASEYSWSISTAINAVLLEGLNVYEQQIELDQMYKAQVAEYAELDGYSEQDREFERTKAIIEAYEKEKAKKARLAKQAKQSQVKKSPTKKTAK